MARKIHISLVGGQTLPVYVPLANDDSITYDIIYLIHSERTEENAVLVKEWIERLRNRTALTELVEFDAVSINRINEDIMVLQSKIDVDDEVWLNVSGGTKPWSVLFYQAFAGRERTNCLYLDQNGFLWNMQKGEWKETTTHNLSFQVLFSLHKVQATYTDLMQYTEKDSEALDRLMDLRREMGAGVFYGLTKDLDTRDEAKEKNWSVRKVNNACYIFDNGIDEEELSSPHIKDMLCNTGWFEYQTARLLSRWHQRKDIIMNVHFRGSATNGEANEVDIIVRTEKKFLFVECKTSVAHPTDLDKFNEVSGQYGGIAVKRMLMIAYEPKRPNKYGKNKIEEDKYKNYNIVMDKCKRYNIPVFVMNKVDYNEYSRRTFFKELDRYMDELNEK